MKTNGQKEEGGDKTKVQRKKKPEVRNKEGSKTKMKQK